MEVKENSYDDGDIEKLKYAFPGLDPYFLALVWEFAEYLFRVQQGLDVWESTKKN